MELLDLKRFVAVAEELHFGRAAERIHLSQPALSLQIQRLEKELGTELFFRNRRRVELTDSGAELLAGARELLSRAETLEAEIQRRSREIEGAVRVGIVGSSLSSRIPEIAKALEAEHPTIRLVVLERKCRELLSLLKDRRLDLAFIYKPEFSTPGIEVEVLAEEEVGIVLPEHHPLADRQSLRLTDLADEPFVLFPRSWAPTIHDRLLETCGDVGFRPRVVQEADHLSTILGLVAAELGVAFATATVMAHHGLTGLRFRCLTGPKPILRPALAHIEGPRSSAVEVVLSLVRRLSCAECRDD